MLRRCLTLAVLAVAAAPSTALATPDFALLGGFSPQTAGTVGEIVKASPNGTLLASTNNTLAGSTNGRASRSSTSRERTSTRRARSRR